MKRKLLENEAKIQNPQPSSALNQDVMNEIAKYVSYKHGLATFRQTNRLNNCLVENTEAGQRARNASDLEPSWKRTSMVSLGDYRNYQIAVFSVSAIIGTVASFANVLDLSKSFSVLTVGESVAAGVAGLIMIADFNSRDSLMSVAQMEKNSRYQAG